MNGRILSPFAKRRIALVVGIVGILVFLFLIFMAFAGSGLISVGGQEVEAIFVDGLNVTPRSSEVRVSGINVGKVDAVSLDGEKVLVTMTVDGSVDLRADATATLRLKSILGEKYVALEPGSDSEPLSGPINDTRVGTDFTTLAAGGPGSFDLNEALRGQTVQDTLQRTAEKVPEQGDLIEQRIARLRQSMDNAVTNQGNIVTTLDNLAIITNALVGASDDLGRLMANGSAIQSKLQTALERAKVNFARIDTSVQVVRALLDGHAEDIDEIVARLGAIQADLKTTWQLFQAGAQLPIAIWGLGPIGYNDPRQLPTGNPFPPYPLYPLPPDTAQ